MEGVFCSMNQGSPAHLLTPFLEELCYLIPAKFFYSVFSLPPQWQFTFSESNYISSLKKCREGMVSKHRSSEWFWLQNLDSHFLLGFYLI